MDLSGVSKQERLNKIFGLYEKYGSMDYIGEPVSQVEHMCQSAQLAVAEGYDQEVILAAFFHDIGHLFALEQNLENMGGYGVKRHEQLGAEYLRKMGLPEKVAKLVENHVQAKRYLTFKFPEYYNRLSEASKQTLVFQGGIMSKEESTAFENDELFELSLKMRLWDELAKEQNIPLPKLENFRKMAEYLIK